MPEFGFADNTAGAGLTVNPLLRVNASLPVVTLILRAPSAAPAVIVILAVALVGVATVTLFKLIPAPKLAVVTPWKKFEKLPVKATSMVWVSLPLAGLAESRVAVGLMIMLPASTVVNAGDAEERVTL